MSFNGIFYRDFFLTFSIPQYFIDILCHKKNQLFSQHVISINFLSYNNNSKFTPVKNHTDHPCDVIIMTNASEHNENVLIKNAFNEMHYT